MREEKYLVVRRAWRKFIRLSVVNILLICGVQQVKAEIKTLSLKEIYLHCPENTKVVFKEIKDSFGVRLKFTDCDLSLINPSLVEDVQNESTARARRIKRRERELQKQKIKS